MPTWSRTSTSSSTSDPRPGPSAGAGWGSRLAGLVRLTHPYPTLVDGAATVAISLVAGGTPGTALRLGAAMVCLQAGIGALNDVVDAPRDAGLKPAKPIPAGVVPAGWGRAVAVAATVVGVLLSLPSGPATGAVAVAIAAVGAAYDLRLKGTPWSWLPFAVGIPLLPVFAWLGSTGSLPPLFAILLPAAVLAGAGLAIGNALVDVERDRARGASSVSASLGPRRAWAVHAALLGGVAIAALATLAGGRSGPGPLLVAVAAAGLLTLGVAFTGGADPRRRERGWELEAAAVGLLAAGWTWGIAPLAG